MNGKIITGIALTAITLFVGSTLYLLSQSEPEPQNALGATPGLRTQQGGTGTTTPPTDLQLLVGQNSGVYGVRTLTAGPNVTISTSTTALTISATGGGGGGGSISTSTTPTVSHLAYWTSPSQLGSIATGTLTESVTGLSLSATRYLIGGASALSLDSGYVIPTTTRLSNHDTAYGWGDHSTQGYLTTVDISDDTNLAVSSPIVLTGDTVGINQSLLSITESQISDLSHYTNGDVSSYLYGSSTLSDLIGTHYTNADVSSYLYSSTTRSDLFTAGTGLSWTGNTLNAEVQSSDLHDAVTLAGEDYLSLSTQQITANAINPDNLASADFGDFTCNGTTCSLDTTYASSLDTAYNGGSSITADSGAVTISGDGLAIATSSQGSSKLTVSGSTTLQASTDEVLLKLINQSGSDHFTLRIDSNGGLSWNNTDDEATRFFISNSAEGVGAPRLYGGLSLSELDIDTYVDLATADEIAFYAGALHILSLTETTQDIIDFNPTGSDVDTVFATDNLDILTLDGGTDTATALGTWNLNGATVRQHTYKTFTWPGSATTTTATNTVPLGSAYTAETWNGAECRATSGSISFVFTDTGTNDMNPRTATTTVGRFTLSTNNTFTVSEQRAVEIGPVTNAQLTCTIDITVNSS